MTMWGVNLPENPVRNYENESRWGHIIYNIYVDLYIATSLENCMYHMI